MNHKLELRLSGEICNLKYAHITTLKTESEEELKSLSMRVKGEWKSWLKLNITKKTNIMVSGPIISWQIEEGKLKAVENFIFLGSKITVDSNCSHEIKKKKNAGSLEENLWQT